MLDILKSLWDDLGREPFQPISQLREQVNHSFYVREGDRDLVVKLISRPPLTPVEQRRFLKTKDIYDKLAKRNLYSVPVDYADDITRTYGDSSIYGVLILEKIEGQPLDDIWDSLSVDHKEAFVIEFADYMKSVHTVEFPGYGEIDVENTSYFGSWKDYVLETARKEGSKLVERKTFSEELVNESVKFIEDHIDEIHYQERPVLIHNDLWSGNVVWNEDQFYLLDWEWSIAGDPVKDFLWIDGFFGEDKSMSSQFVNNYGMIDPNLSIKKRCLSILAGMETCATGWVFHNPSRESFDYQAGLIRKQLDGTM
ncbi:MAG: phosphotransferase [Candidatus Kariarchaeaceae archaeon]|jgi:aminoglycoside phosphotransferase (APT) family kinase protein